MKDIQKQIYKLWESGYPASEIAKEVCITRNAVMGHLFRMRQAGVKMRQKPPSANAKKAAPPPPKRTVGVKKMPRRLPAPIKPTLEEINPPPLIPNGDPVPMMKLARFSCRYVVSGVDAKSFLFCNAKARDNSSYCPHHHAICYVPFSNAKPRRKPNDATA